MGGSGVTGRLSEEQTQQFIRDGYVLVGGLLPPELVATTRDELLAGLGIDPGVPAT
jgi:hypothetical protein